MTRTLGFTLRKVFLAEAHLPPGKDLDDAILAIVSIAQVLAICAVRSVALISEHKRGRFEASCLLF